MTEEISPSEDEFEPQIVNEVTRHLLNPSQSTILKKITLLFGDLAGQLYSDVCRMAGKPGEAYHAQRHLIGHLMREMERVAREYLLDLVSFIYAEKIEEEKQKQSILGRLFALFIEKDEKKKTSTKELEQYLKGHKKQIQYINNAFGFDQDSALYKSWLTLITKQKEGYNALHGEAHISSSARIMTELFKDIISTFDAWLQNVISAVEKTYDNYLQQINEIKNNPNVSSAKLFCSLPKTQVIQNYFFKDNNEPAWLSLLADQGYFKSLPSPAIKIDDNEMIHSGWWPAGQYLTRMASHSEKTGAKVVEIAKHIKWKSNNFVVHDIINITAALPDNLSLLVSDLILDIFGQDDLDINRVFLRDAIVIAKKWSNAGQIDKALQLSSAILKTQVGKKGSELTGVFGDDYFYNAAVSSTAAFAISKSPLKALALFSSSLDSALENSFGNEHQKEAERIFHSRGEIDNDGPHYTDKIINSLITAIRSSLSEILKNGTPQEIAKAFLVMKSYDWKIFTRISFSVASKNIHKSKEHILDSFMDFENFKSGLLDSEYKDLASVIVPTLGETELAIITSFLDSGYDLDNIRKNHAFFNNGEEPTEKELAEKIVRWKKHKLSGWLDALPASWKETHADLIDERSIAPRRKNNLMVNTRWGSISPIKSDELVKMPSEKLIEYLQTWKPTSFGFDDPTIEGLEQVLKEAVMLEPKRFSELSKEFVALPHYYIGRLFAGLQETKDKSTYDWSALLELVDWVAQQEDTPEAEEAGNAEWYWTKNNAVDLIGYILKDRKAKIPLGLIDKAFDILIRIIEGKDYQVEKDINKGGYEKAINTLRGRGIEILIRFVLKIKRLEKEGDTSLLHFIPNAFNLLTESVDPNTDGSSITRSIIGVLFPWVNLANPEWVQAHLADIFKQPINEDEAWKAFIEHTDPYKELYELLIPFYTDAIKQAASTHSDKEVNSDYESYLERLPGHIMLMMMAHDLDVKSESNVVGQFAKLANDQNFSDAADYLALYLNSDKLNSDYLRSIVKYLDFRLNTIEKENEDKSFQNELGSYTLFVHSNHLTVKMKARILNVILKNKAKIKRPHEFFSSFGALNADDLDLLIPFLEHILTSPELDYWDIAAYQDDIITALKKGLASGNPETKRIVTELRSKLSVQGHTKIFSELIESKEV